MAIIEELRTPLYFAAGTADLAVQQAKKVPGLIEQLRTEAPARIDAVRNTDPKVVQEKVTAQAKEAQAKVTEVLGSLDTDLKKLGETAQDFALRSVGVAAEYAVRARETYERVAEHGEQAVRQWRGEAAEELTEIAVAVEPDSPATPSSTTASTPASPAGDRAESAAKKPAPAKKAPVARKPAAKKTTTPADQ
ncbi:hypothetical protein [Streptomyces sp. NRRL S-118]|uniref:hypothetical protein n=1 Tax=Streptomyces sp. NRRL S-118 TaxID=1463881 RepID=UPI0004C54C09|nr:hypothetical protein [Streptomyces sp. NRRL S-118]